MSLTLLPKELTFDGNGGVTGTYNDSSLATRLGVGNPFTVQAGSTYAVGTDGSFTATLNIGQPDPLTWSGAVGTLNQIVFTNRLPNLTAGTGSLTALGNAALLRHDPTVRGRTATDPQDTDLLTSDWSYYHSVLYTNGNCTLDNGERTRRVANVTVETDTNNSLRIRKLGDPVPIQNEEPFTSEGFEVDITIERDANGCIVTTADKGDIRVFNGVGYRNYNNVSAVTVAGNAADGFTIEITADNGGDSSQNADTSQNPPAGGKRTITIRMTRAGDISNQTVGAPGQATFVQQPTNRILGQVFDPPIVVDVRDDNGLPVADGTVVTLSRGIDPNPAGASRLLGTLQATTNNGLATFETVILQGVAGNGYTLQIDVGSVSFQSATFNLAGEPAFTMSRSSVQADGSQLATGGRAPSVSSDQRVAFDGISVAGQVRQEPAGPNFPGVSGLGPSISADGRFVSFDTAMGLVGLDTNGLNDVYVLEVATGTLTRVSVATGGAQSTTGPSFNSRISADGRYVTFQSQAQDLVATDTNGVTDIFLHDRQTNATVMASLNSDGTTQADAPCVTPAISGDGRYVVFSTTATTLDAMDTNVRSDIYRFDRANGQTVRASFADGGAQISNAGATNPDLSDDGNFIAFLATDGDTVTGDDNGAADVFLHNLTTRTTIRASVRFNGQQGTGGTLFPRPSLSADGRYVAYHHDMTDLVPNDTNGVSDVFVFDALTGSVRRVSVDGTGAQNAVPATNASISRDGRFVGFQSADGTLVAGDINGVLDVFLGRNTLAP